MCLMAADWLEELTSQTPSWTKGRGMKGGEKKGREWKGMGKKVDVRTHYEILRMYTNVARHCKADSISKYYKYAENVFQCMYRCISRLCVT